MQSKQAESRNSLELSNLENRRIAIKEMLHPRNMSELRTFLGMINHLNKVATRMYDKTKPKDRTIYLFIHPRGITVERIKACDTRIFKI